MDNLLCVTHGSKTIHLYSPWDIASLYPRGRHVLPIQSAVKSSVNADLLKYPLFARARANMWTGVVGSSAPQP